MSGLRRAGCESEGVRERASRRENDGTNVGMARRPSRRDRCTFSSLCGNSVALARHFLSSVTAPASSLRVPRGKQRVSEGGFEKIFQRRVQLEGERVGIQSRTGAAEERR